MPRQANSGHGRKVHPRGVYGRFRSEVELLPKDLSGKRAIELGCGTAYVSSWLARRGSRAVGIDNSVAQLATARRLQLEHSLYFPLIHGDAERMPFADATFDFAISEYGACLWADQCWVAEAARLLRLRRPAGLLDQFVPADAVRTGGGRPGSDGASTAPRIRDEPNQMAWAIKVSKFHLSHGDWIQLLRRSGFEVEDLVEIRPAAGATSRYRFVTLRWARQWPCEEVLEGAQADLMEPEFEHYIPEVFLRRDPSAVMNDCKEYLHRFRAFGEEESDDAARCSLQWRFFRD